MRLAPCLLLLVSHVCFADGFALRGKVTGDGKPVAGASVHVRAVAVVAACKGSQPCPRTVVGPKIATPIVKTDADGSYAFSDLPKFDYYLTISAAGWRTRDVRVALTADHTVDVVLAK